MSTFDVYAFGKKLGRPGEGKVTLASGVTFKMAAEVKASILTRQQLADETAAMVPTDKQTEKGGVPVSYPKQETVEGDKRTPVRHFRPSVMYHLVLQTPQDALEIDDNGEAVVVGETKTPDKGGETETPDKGRKDKGRKDKGRQTGNSATPAHAEETVGTNGQA